MERHGEKSNASSKESSLVYPARRGLPCEDQTGEPWVGGPVKLFGVSMYGVYFREHYV